MDDLISRQAAIDAIRASTSKYTGFMEMEMYTDDDAVEAIKALPSAEPEIIRCKDCEWWDRIDDGPYGYCLSCKHGFYSANWEISIYRRYKEDFFCADGERRTDG